MTSYIDRVKRFLSVLNTTEIGRVIEVLQGIKEQGGVIFTMGNGGSGCTASHLTQDISKGKGYRAICLCDNMASILAYGNDIAFDSIFKEQLSLWLTDKDAVIGISCSGRSKNVIEALSLANERHAATIGLVGFDGGEIKDMVDIPIHVPITDMQICEDCHSIVAHMIYKML